MIDDEDKKQKNIKPEHQDDEQSSYSHTDSEAKDSAADLLKKSSNDEGSIKEHLDSNNDQPDELSSQNSKEHSQDQGFYQDEGAYKSEDSYSHTDSEDLEANDFAADLLHKSSNNDQPDELSSQNSKDYSQDEGFYQDEGSYKSEDSYNENDMRSDKENFVQSETEEEFFLEREEDSDDNLIDAEPEVKDKPSAVAISKKKSQLIMAIVGIVSIYIIYNSFQPTQEEASTLSSKQEVSDLTKTILPPKTVDQSMLEPQVPALPVAPKLIAPSAPPPPLMDIPAPPPSPAQISVAKNNDAKPLEKIFTPNQNIPPPPGSQQGGLTDEEKMARLKSKMNIISGSGGSRMNLVDSGNDGTDSIALTSNRIKATKLGNLATIVGQGKMIDAILETAVNTDLPGVVRGIVSKNIYSEAGGNILIPRGSRLIGEYKSGVALGQQRVEINWSRLIRPDGIDIALNSIATDSIGRGGLQGNVDNKYSQMFTNTILLSIINIGVARWQDIRDKASGTTAPKQEWSKDTNCSTNPLTNIETCKGGYVPIGEVNQPNNEDKAYTKAGEDVTGLAKDILNKHIEKLKPTITIDQGTHVRVFVQSDLVFPQNNFRILK